MRRVPALARPGESLCLLGSFLALVAFFLPYWSPPAGSFFPPASLADGFTSCGALDQLFQSNDTSFGVGALSIGVLLLLLLGMAILALLALVLRAPRPKIITITLNLTKLTLIYYLVAAFITFFAAWVDEALGATVTVMDVLSWVGIGAWFILAGLAVALIGGILLKRQEPKAGG